MPYTFTDGDQGSSFNLNRGLNHRLTGAELAAANPATMPWVLPGLHAYCTTTGSGFTAGKEYRRALDNNSWEVVSLTNHTHIDNDSGGRLADTLAANVPLTIDYDKRWAKAAEFWHDVASNGTITDEASNGRILLQTSSTSGGRATMSDGGARKLNFAFDSLFESTIQVSSATNFSVKLGVAAEDINAGNLTPAKYGIEGCSTSGSVWLVFSSDGTTRTTTATASSVATGGAKVYRVEHDSATSVKLYIDGVLSISKSTNVPSTGTTGFNDLYRAGIKNSAAENKVLYHWGGARIVGGI